MTFSEGRFLLKTALPAIVLLTVTISAEAQHQTGVRGSIRTVEGDALAFASIYVRQTRTGTTANEDGDYEIALPPGRYELVFQHLGRRTEVRVVEVADTLLTLNIQLQEQEITLETITIDAGAEDPAYTIMRKAIAKADYHRNSLDGYTARVYIKGAGKLKDYPWLAKKQLEKEGVEKGRVYISESVSEIRYTRPGKFEEKVISIRSDGKDNNTSPNAYIFGSFYEPEVAETVSPLSPRAFSYYRFEYQGTFKDRNYDVSRIKVIPRSRSEEVIDGVINIVEDSWAIHSLDIHTVKLGIDIFMKVTFAPIDEKAWLPVSHSFRVDGKIFGFEFEYNYLASVSDYKVIVNPELYVEKIEVIDEKADREAAARARENRAAVQNSETKKLAERLAEGEEITRKELKKVMKEYEREERRVSREPEVISESVFSIDSTAYKKDSAYWVNIRPIPLTREEERGYQKVDSLAAIDETDTLKESKHSGFQPWDILIGDHYRIGKNSHFRIYTPFPNFNTVEGLNIDYRIAVGTVARDTNRTRISVSPILRYAFARERFGGFVRFQLRNRKNRLEIESGRYPEQYNSDDPILPPINTLTTLLLEQNLMKLYERDFTELRYRRVIGPYITAQTTWSFAHRRELFNNSGFKLIDRKGIEDYTPNRPINSELDETGFPEHQALVGMVRVDARPWLKYRMRNGVKYPIRHSSPTFTVAYRRGFRNVLSSDVDYDHIEGGVRHVIDVGARGSFDVAFNGGTFLSRTQVPFIDYKHFQSNRTPFTTTDPLGGFRFLDYYLLSTTNPYFSAHVQYRLPKFLLTTIPEVRLAGIRENFFASYLNTSGGNYLEVGYAIDGILRFFRLEGGVYFRNGQYQDLGFRIGIASSLIQIND